LIENRKRPLLRRLAKNCCSKTFRIELIRHFLESEREFVLILVQMRPLLQQPGRKLFANHVSKHVLFVVGSNPDAELHSFSFKRDLLSNGSLKNSS
jgi:hypothetical protein